MTRAALCIALLSCGYAVVEAQESVPVPPAAAANPLDRRISIHLRDVALREALDRVSILAGVRLSFSGDVLPLDRRVSLSRDNAAMASVLAELLRGYAVLPIAVGSDHVVLTPGEPHIRDSSFHLVPVLDRVVVTGSVIGASERPLPVALDVIAGRDLERRDQATLSQVFDGTVPGIWMWEQSPSSLLARYGSIRGASSFGLSLPKVYIDGIEVANPLLLTQITPELVERIEVIRGPQGAALYGADAISGVVNIVSRYEGNSPDGSRIRLRSEGGYASSAYADGAIAVQEHALTVRGGSNLRAAGFTVGGSTSGEYVPQAYSRELRTTGDARVVGSRSTLTAHARFYAKDAGVAVSPLLDALNPHRLDADAGPQELRTYSLGSTALLAPNDRWTYALTAGIDGYRLANVSSEMTPVPSVADTALRDANGSAVRGTLRAGAISRTAVHDDIGATLTFAAEHSTLWDNTSQAVVPMQTSGSGSGRSPENVSATTSTTGVSSQINVSINDAAYVTTGLRLEHIGQTILRSQLALLPMLGGALVKDYGGTTLKVRAAYGKGIRAPRSTAHLAARDPRRTVVSSGLRPEEQSGVEAGADLFLGRRLGLHVTRFDQLASGLIQLVTIGDPMAGNSGPGSSRYWFELQNVGEITNRGWETQVSAALASLTIAGSATFVDSRVRRLAQGYKGDLQPGDRMLAVPARTIGGTVSWTHRALHLSSSLARASDWINYDRLAIAEAWIDASDDPTAVTGSNLRAFWRKYPGTTRLRGTMSYDVRRDLMLTLTGENLLNHQRGEPDTITIVPGRTIAAGIRARF